MFLKRLIWREKSLFCIVKTQCKVTFLVRNQLAFRTGKHTSISSIKGIHCPHVQTLMVSEVIDIKALPWWRRNTENARNFSLCVTTFAMATILFPHDIESLGNLGTFFTNRWGDIFAEFRLARYSKYSLKLYVSPSRYFQYLALAPLPLIFCSEEEIWFVW